MWKHLKHPNVLPLLGVTLGEHRFAMVSEWMENGNINSFIERDRHANGTELVCCWLIFGPQLMVAIQLVDATNGLMYMHGLRLVHGDLKGVFSSLQPNSSSSHASLPRRISWSTRADVLASRTSVFRL